MSEEAQTFPPHFDGMKKKERKRETWQSENTGGMQGSRGQQMFTPAFGGGGGEIIRMTFSARRRSPAVSSAGCSFGGTSLNINMAALI